MDRLPDYLKMIRDRGMIPGLSAHMPELILYSDLNDYDVETYIQIYNCMGFLMQVEIESAVNKIIWNAKKPGDDHQVHGGRPLLARLWASPSPISTLRPCDMVTVGAMTARGGRTRTWRSAWPPSSAAARTWRAATAPTRPTSSSNPRKREKPGGRARSVSVRGPRVFCPRFRR